MAKSRSFYDMTPLFGKFTQGAIINGCIAESFPGEEVYGFIITPRCDLGHVNKVTTVHYVPVVPFERWFDVIAKPIIYEQWKKTISNNLNSRFLKAKVGSNVMDANLTYDDLLKIVSAKVKANDQASIIQLLDQYFGKDEEAFSQYLFEGLDFLDTKKEKKHLSTDYLKRLRDNEIAAYYLIEGWPDYNKEKHLVVMLRDVRRIEISVARLIKDGVKETDLFAIDKTHNDLYFTSRGDNFYWVQALVNSPFVEHVMQAFVYNFSRIGVEDRTGNTSELLYNSSISTIL